MTQPVPNVVTKQETCINIFERLHFIYKKHLYKELDLSQSQRNLIVAYKNIPGSLFPSYQSDLMTKN